ncbi:hypothetical protein Cme02nite_35860 [Catellatospora methionotrophica]|uniref:Uncharacterized protein n=1 Tax=Catellatospora methionotrophica TaxID=121620 RepID=A0A8J3LBD5_9ACTN|nr:hypothetical protein [Catellatospora methionotrophica]GIG15254.1 hypothetical protein Cme02nite_35860 [Catellatospora methionotrophica]
MSAASVNRPDRPNPPATLVFSAPEEPRTDTRDAAEPRPIALDPFAVPAAGSAHAGA